MVRNTIRSSAGSNADSRIGEGHVAQVTNVPKGGVPQAGGFAPSGETINRVEVATTPEQGVAPPGEEDLFAQFLRDCNGAPNSPLPEPYRQPTIDPQRSSDPLTPFRAKRGRAWRAIQEALSHYRQRQMDLNFQLQSEINGILIWLIGQ